MGNFRRVRTTAVAVLSLVFAGGAFGYDPIRAGQTLFNQSTVGQPTVSGPCCDSTTFNHPEKTYQFHTPRGHCSETVAAFCSVNADCPAGETCSATTVDGVATVRVTGLQTVSPAGHTYYPAVSISTTPGGPPDAFGGCETTTTASSSTELRVEHVKSDTDYYITVDGSSAMNSYGQAVTGNFNIQLLWGQTYGSVRVVPNQGAISSVVKMRYRFAVANNDTVPKSCQAATWKIGFMPEQFTGSGGVLGEFCGGGIQASIHSDRGTYANGPDTYPCQQVTPTGLSEAGIAFGIETDGNSSCCGCGEAGCSDQNVNQLGSQTEDATFFPKLTQFVDYQTGCWTHGFTGQLNMNARKATLTVARLPDRNSQTTGWSCAVPALTADNRWEWRQTLDLRDGSLHSVDFVLPSARGQYLDSLLMMTLYSEAFYVHRGLMRLYYWGFEVQQENSSTWIPLSSWLLDRTDADSTIPPLYNFGFRPAVYAGHNAVELSNDPTETGYVHRNGTLPTAVNPNCDEHICVPTSTTACTISSSVALTPGCELDLNDQEVTIAAGATVSSTGAFTITAQKLLIYGTVRSTGGAGTIVSLNTTSHFIQTETGSLLENKGGWIILSSANGIDHIGTIDVSTGGSIFWFAGTGKDVALRGPVHAEGGVFSIGVAFGIAQACSVYITNGGNSYANSTVVAYAGGFNDGPSGSGFSTNTATVYCRCPNPSQCNACADAPATGTFFNGSGPVTPTFSYQAFPTCSGGCS